ncbi:hypothetical protein PAXINDRAFT_11822 [Paxillus involutus ATCC 200175]|uniref:Unplaced genomic scaffold PAXINscaffold_15, whole genome shotgun sequence n=1 Tax=Paxillus involutus ATCC 200175 TaxID=664439 RepID=A0A0C9TYA6_PAXIN|nr:hypothetical protein PAXINDRAFT_11822 [Paxillus involutus ATCC 200175]
MSLCPTLQTPFVTLHSSHYVLGLDTAIHILPDMCASCNINLFLPTQTKHGNDRAVKSPIINYPYLPLSEQIKRLLKIPGLEAVLDEWQTKVQKPGEYIDIFDGDICRTRLKGPNGKLFFSNKDNEKQGPNGELCIGVNLGIDWFSYIRVTSRRHIPPVQHHSLFATSRLSIDLLHLWKFGIKIPTEWCPEGRLVHIVLVAVVCDKPAAHKIGGFASHSHTHFCMTCWISLDNKTKAKAFQKGAFKPQTNEEQRDLGDRYQGLTNLNARKIFIKEYATRYTQLSQP